MWPEGLGQSADPNDDISEQLDLQGKELSAFRPFTKLEVQKLSAVHEF